VGFSVELCSQRICVVFNEFCAPVLWSCEVSPIADVDAYFINALIVIDTAIIAKVRKRNAAVLDPACRDQKILFCAHNQ